MISIGAAERFRLSGMIVAGWLACALFFTGCASRPADPLAASATYAARIERTRGGIPHITAANLESLGFGTLYAMAEDNVCILADQAMTFGAERARYLGAGERDANVASDFFYRFLIDRGDAKMPLPADLERLFEGAAAGYNRYLESTTATAIPDPTCRGAEWIRPISAIDLKRVSRIDYALAYMLPILVAAAPPEASEARPLSDLNRPDPAMRFAPEQIAARVAAYLEVPKQGGSNGVALGRAVTESGGGMLLANPHMAWNNSFQRFYPMHQTIPGKVNVFGANLIGRPRVGFGHTEHVAWTSTVSTAKRLSFYRLELSPGDPTAYVFDGRTFAMTPHVVTSSVRNMAGEFEERSHTFYTTHFGGILVESPFFAWTREQAFAVRLVDAQWRGETSLADQYAAQSVRELKAVHDANQFLPVNLIAADHTGEVLYADPGPIPNLPDAVVADCAVLGGAALDGARRECQWRDDASAAAPGVFPPARLPFLYRQDYVTNSNDSYWLTNPAAPLEGYAESIGSERTERTLRTRSGLDMVQREIAKPGGVTLTALQDLALSNESHAGRLLRDALVALCRASPDVRFEDGLTVDLREACDVLSAWDLHANLESRGAHLFRQFAAEANGPQYTRHLPNSFVPRTAFDVSEPVRTPSGLDATQNPNILKFLARAVLVFEKAGLALDAPLGEIQGVVRNGVRIPLHGGPESEGIFNKIESDLRGSAGYADVDRWSSSWILAVEFTKTGPRSRGILAYSISANPDSPHFTDQTRLFSNKEWIEIPFDAKRVTAQALRSYEVKSP